MLKLNLKSGARRETAFPEMEHRAFLLFGDGAQRVDMALLEAGLAGTGAPSLTLRFTLPDGRDVYVELDPNSFVRAAAHLKKTRPDMFEAEAV